MKLLKRVMITVLIAGTMAFAETPPTCGANCPDGAAAPPPPSSITSSAAPGYFFMWVVVKMAEIIQLGF